MKIALKIPGFGTVNPPGGVPTGGADDIEKIIRYGVTVLMVVSTILALFFLIYGGIRWITSGGDKAGVEGARKIITYALIGLIIIFCSFAILNFVSSIFGVNYLSTPSGGGGGSHLPR